MSSVSARSPRLVASAALALALIAATGVASPRARVAGRDRVGRAVTARLGSTRVDDRLTWVAPDPSAGGGAALTTGAEPLVRPTKASRAVLMRAPVLARPALGPSVRLARVSDTRAFACAPVDPPGGRAPPLA